MDGEALIFSSATAVRQVGPSRFSSAIEPGWDIAGNANGRYLLAIAARAASSAAGGAPPTTFMAHLPVAWTPTPELTAYIRSLPSPGRLRCSFTTRFITGGFIEEDGEVCDASGRLVAQSRQLALLPRG